MNKSKALIVGCNGFLAKVLARTCASSGFAVDGVFRENMDVSARSLYRTAIPVTDWRMDVDYDYVFLLASYVPYGQMATPARAYVERNIGLVLRIVDRYWNSKIVFSSSVSVYGIQDQVITENSEFRSPSFYGLSKLAGEFIVRNAPQHGVIRFSSIVGPGMTTKTFVGKVVAGAKSSGQITLTGDGSRCQDYIHVQDAADLLLQAARHAENDVFLGVSGVSRPNSEVVAAVAQMVPGCSVNRIGGDASPSFYFDNTYTNAKLHPSGIYRSLECAIKEMVEA